ncbi:hypothetical protein PGTUg99_010082 [Puccinia graminis f. sp. tritici]|uniref:Uncharacterized protein n=1 Tax=Puccinia graminis f. sp. tritici TaxID=56615 RepID=A0A5B0SG55_PUCGR|nr:hypothetical protein PGTUg99_010082 [Puccinia graminis f. sp. tritici]
MAYILQLVPLLNCCASASSDQADSIRIFDLQRTDKPTIELEYSEQLGRLSQLKSHQQSLLIGCFSSSPAVLGWDLRSADHRPSLELTGHSSTPFLSLGHSAGSVIAAGTSNDDDCSSGQIELFDLRRGTKPYCLYDQAHSDSITSLEFNPSCSDHQLLSASTDGLLVLHDTRIVDQEESILFTSNTGASLAHARWQPDGRTIWAGSDMETLSRWDAEQLSLLKDYGDLRQDSLAKTDPSWHEPVSYLISLATPSPTQSAYFAGSQSGDVVLVETTDPETERWKVLGSFKGGHSEMVRCATLDSQNSVVLTGGEDGRICIWSNDRESEASFRLVDRFNPFSTPIIHSPKEPNPTHLQLKPDSSLKTLSSKDNRFKPYNRH